MATSEYCSCPPRLPTPTASHVAIASGVNHRVTSPRWTSARSYAGQFPTRYFVLYLGCTLDFTSRSCPFGRHDGQGRDEHLLPRTNADNRRDGLEQIIATGAQINMAMRGIKWPGTANLVVSLLALHKGEWNGPKMLDNQPVEMINTFFEEGESLGAPNSILENHDKVFQGSIFLGDGFLLSHEEANRLCASDARNAEVIMPVINGKELNNEPDQAPGRSIINFRDWSLERAQEFTRLFSIVVEKVKPDRETQKDKGGREFWWRFLRPRIEMVSRIRDLPHCFVTGRVTKHMNFSAMPTDIVFLNNCYVFTTDRWDLFAVVQSTLH